MFRPAVPATLLCALATAAAVVSFTRGAWVGVVWVLLAGLTSNMAWYYVRRARTARGSAPAAAPGVCASGGACGSCGSFAKKAR